MLALGGLAYALYSAIALKLIWGGAILAALCIGLAVSVRFYPGRLARRMFHSYNRKAGETTYTFTDDCIRVQNALEAGEVRYDALTRLVETPACWLLFRSEA